MDQTLPYPIGEFIKPHLTDTSSIQSAMSLCLKSLHENDLQRSYIHPENNSEYKLDLAILLYAWHSNHHLAHITTLKFNNNW